MWRTGKQQLLISGSCFLCRITSCVSYAWPKKISLIYTVIAWSGFLLICLLDQTKACICIQYIQSAKYEVHCKYLHRAACGSRFVDKWGRPEDLTKNGENQRISEIGAWCVCDAVDKLLFNSRIYYSGTILKCYQYAGGMWCKSIRSLRVQAKSYLKFNGVHDLLQSDKPFSSYDQFKNLDRKIFIRVQAKSYFRISGAHDLSQLDKPFKVCGQIKNLDRKVFTENHPHMWNLRQAALMLPPMNESYSKSWSMTSSVERIRKYSIGQEEGTLARAWGSILVSRLKMNRDLRLVWVPYRVASGLKDGFAD